MLDGLGNTLVVGGVYVFSTNTPNCYTTTIGTLKRASKNKASINPIKTIEHSFGCTTTYQHDIKASRVSVPCYMLIPVATCQPPQNKY